MNCVAFVLQNTLIWLVLRKSEVYDVFKAFTFKKLVHSIDLFTAQKRGLHQASNTVKFVKKSNSMTAILRLMCKLNNCELILRKCVDNKLSEKYSEI